MSAPKKAPSLETLRARAATEYGIDEANEAVSFPYSPARATAAIAKRYGIPADPLVGLVAEVYYRENGTRAPLAIRVGKSGRPTEKAVATAVRKRRDARGRLGRWEVLAYSLATALDLAERPSVGVVKAYYDAAGGDRAASYTGRGTRVGAPATRASATAEIATDA
jgi:hypothetical protein